MADIQFEEPQYRESGPAYIVSGFAALLISWGIAADERQARRILLVIAVLAFAVAVAIPLYANRSAPQRAPDFSQVDRLPTPAAQNP